jgi:nucleoside-diphosphate-sugar epimerase
MSKVLVTGSQGFIASYIIPELLSKGYDVVGLDNEVKYGPIKRLFDDHPNYHYIKGDAKDAQLVTALLNDCDHFIAGAALIGGITFFNSWPATLLCENERILASSFEAANHAHKHSKLKKITVLSSSMIYERATTFPSKEGDEEKIAPPITCYGFQKLAVHYFAKGFLSEHGLPYSIGCPFNCVGTGELKSEKFDKEIMSGNVKLAMSHVIPDLINKVYKGQYPVHILGSGSQRRHFTYGADLARGIVTLMEDETHLNRSFNLSTPHGHSVNEVLQMIWDRLGNGKELQVINDPGYDFDVENRVPDVTDAKELLDFEATMTLDKILDEIIPFYISDEFQKNS